MPNGKGMYLLVNPSGSKYFRFDCRFDSKSKTLALGVYPDTSLNQAREAFSCPHRSRRNPQKNSGVLNCTSYLYQLRQLPYWKTSGR